jgi:D-sedoheptulose 7-phosphate isomerase
MLALATASLKRSLAVVQDFEGLGLPQVVHAAEAIAQSLAKGGKLLIFGNGGSAADAQHMAGEMVNRFLMERPSLPAIALTTDTSVLTAIGNDYHFDEIFVKQVKALGREGDVALGISTSGRSPNVVKALAAARGKGMTNLGLTGREGGDMGPLCDVLMCAPSEETPRIQEVHALVIHILCELVDIKLFGRAR